MQLSGLLDGGIASSRGEEDGDSRHIPQADRRSSNPTLLRCLDSVVNASAVVNEPQA